MRRIASYARNEIIPTGAKRQVRNWEVVSCTFLNSLMKAVLFKKIYVWVKGEGVKLDCRNQPFYTYFTFLVYGY